MMTEFTHINTQGEANMVDVSGKQETVREARAEGKGSITCLLILFFSLTLTC